MARWENQAVINTAYMEGFEKGRLKAKQAAIIGVVEAGFHEGWSIEYSAKITNLPISKIQEIYAHLSNSAKQNSEV